MIKDIDELISKLTEIKNEHGNVRIGIHDCDTGWPMCIKNITHSADNFAFLIKSIKYCDTDLLFDNEIIEALRKKV